MPLAAATVSIAVGVFDAITWDSGLFHSYLAYIHLNLALGDLLTGASPAWEYLYWLLIASMGLAVLCVLAALRDLRRYALLLLLITLVLLIHSLQSHKMYRFIFAIIPLWLLMGSDILARLWENKLRPSLGLAPLALAAALVAISLAGILNALPHQARVYQSHTGVTGIVGFLRNQDPIFAAYRYLASASGVSAVWQVDRPYFNLPGYYYLHRAIPVLRRRYRGSHIRGPKKDRGRRDCSFGQPHRVGGPGYFHSWLLGRKNIRHHPHPAPRCR